MTSINEIILAEAQRMRGVKEIVGPQHNPKVLAMYADAGHPEIRTDEVPWCAAFVGSTLAKVGLPTTNSLLAKSYLKWGQEVKDLEHAHPGDVVVFDRGTKSWQGHVGFLVGWHGDTVEVLGGNQGNEVNVGKYKRSKLAGIRRAKPQKASKTESTTLQASVVGGGSTAVAGVGAVSQLDGNAQLVVAFGCIVAVLAFAWIFRERIKKWAAGVR